MKMKYYEFVKNLIVNHKKYQGLEPILENIIDDVFAHSEVVIGNITNEVVVQSYLEKVVSTSIITVPKKLNFKTELQQTKHYDSANDIIQRSVNNDLVDKMINSSFSNKAQTETILQIEEENLDDLEVEDNSLETIEEFQPELSLQEEVLLEEDMEENLIQEEIIEEFQPELSLQEEVLVEEKVENSTNSNFSPVDYSRFEFISSYDNTLDESEIESLKNAITDLDKKHPELNVVKIYELKYKENSSVEQIAQILDIQKDTVLEVLGEIISLI